MKFPFSIVTLFLLVVMSVFSACKKDNPVTPDSQYPAEVASLIENSCAVEGCHIGSNPESNLNLETWTDAFKGSDFGAVIIPFQSQWSHVFQHVNTYDALGVKATPVMPPDGPVLSEAEVLTLKTWIDEGALNNKASYRWATQRQKHTGKLFVLCAGSDLVAVSDLESNLIMEYFSVGANPTRIESPHFITLSPDKQYAYLTLLTSGDNGGTPIVEKYRTDTYEFMGRVTVGPEPALLSLNPAGDRAVLTHFNSSASTAKVTLLDTETMTVLDAVIGDGDLVASPHGLASTSDFRYHYTAASFGNYFVRWEIQNDRFVDFEKFVMDPAIGTPAPSRIYDPYQCLLLEDQGLLFITQNKTDEVRVFDINQGHQLVKAITTGSWPRLMTYDAVSNRLFVACAKEENFAEQGSLQGCVSVIDVSTLAEEKRIYRVGQRPHGLSVDGAARRLYVSSENNGGADPPHHFVDGMTGPPGKYNVVDLNTLEVIPSMETELAVNPNALVVSEE